MWLLRVCLGSSELLHDIGGFHFVHVGLHQTLKWRLFDVPRCTTHCNAAHWAGGSTGAFIGQWLRGIEAITAFRTAFALALRLLLAFAFAAPLVGSTASTLASPSSISKSGSCTQQSNGAISI
ncbi:unnamed protein product [Cladocopium goreaui]|uniref:Uncharacterized protein n=1 Tax=Cladocopium goreaui TaxID=2562237 RepID=A0A9P1CZL3_9DINO|nr:unnamed protein product [Cladocopium goreaui]